MSGETVSRALSDRFSEIGRSELARLHKKITAVGPAHGAQVEGLSAEVLTGIAARLAGAIRRADEPSVLEVVSTLFGVSHETGELAAR